MDIYHQTCELAKTLDVVEDFSDADLVKNSRVLFNIARNKQVDSSDKFPKTMGLY